MKYTHLLLDIDGTLLDFEKAQQLVFYNTMRHFGVDADEYMLNVYAQINGGYWEKLEKGLITKKELVVARFKDFIENYNFTFSPCEMNKIYLDNLANEAPMFDFVAETMDALKQRGYIMAAITNGVERTQTNRIKISGLDKYFDQVFISEQIGFEKPDIGFFERIESAYFGIEKKNMLIVGDSLMADIKLGLAAGVDTCWVNSKHVEQGKIKPLYTIEHFNCILQILDGENLCH